MSSMLLQNCPKCGSKVKAQGIPYYIVCNCGAGFVPGIYEWEEFVKRWNSLKKEDVYKKTLKEFREEFLNSNELIADISMFGDVPDELYGEDVYNHFLLFKNEKVAVDYICETYNLCRDVITKELHEEDSFREEFGKKNYMRSASVSPALFINELDDGTYILWEAY